MTELERKTALRLLSTITDVTIASDLESGIYQNSQTYQYNNSDIYKSRFRVIFHNLLNTVYDNGKRLINEIRNGTIDPVVMARDWTHRQMFDRIYTEYEEELAEDLRRKERNAQKWVEGIMSTATCGKCRKEGRPCNRVMITQAQTRSACVFNMFTLVWLVFGIHILTRKFTISVTKLLPFIIIVWNVPIDGYTQDKNKTSFIPTYSP